MPVDQTFLNASNYNDPNLGQNTLQLSQPNTGFRQTPKMTPNSLLSGPQGGRAKSATQTAIPQPSYLQAPPGIGQSGSQGVGDINPDNYLKSLKESQMLGVQNLKNQVLGENPYIDILMKKYIGEVGARGAARKGAMNQRLAQQGADPTLINTMGRMSDRDTESAQGKITSELGLEEIRQQERANQQLIDTTTQLSEIEKNDIKGQISQLINLGGIKNITQATLLNKKLNGTDIDFHKIKSQNSNSILGQYATIPGISIEQAVQMAQERGDLEFLGISAQEATEFLRPLFESSNPINKITAEADAMLKAGQIDQQEHDNMILIAKQKATGTEGFDISQGFIIKDAQGQTVKKLKTQAEVDSWLAKNKGEFSVGQGKVIFKEGEYKKFHGKEIGEVFEEKGAHYIIDDNGNKIKAKFNVSEPFSDIGDKILELYEIGDITSKSKFKKLPKQVRKILDSRKSWLLGHPNSWPSDLDINSPVYQLIKNDLSTAVMDGITNNTAKRGKVWVLKDFEGKTVGDFITIKSASGKETIYKFTQHEAIDEYFDKGSLYTIIDPITGRVLKYEIDEDGRASLSTVNNPRNKKAFVNAML